MKKFILFILIAILTEQVFCQSANDFLKSVQNDYIQVKNRNQKNPIWSPLIIVARNKLRVISFSFKKEKSLVPFIGGLTYHSYPVLSLKINLDNHSLKHCL